MRIIINEEKFSKIFENYNLINETIDYNLLNSLKTTLSNVGVSIDVKVSDFTPIEEVLHDYWYIQKLNSLGYENCIYINTRNSFIIMLEDDNLITGYGNGFGSVFDELFDIYEIYYGDNILKKYNLETYDDGNNGLIMFTMDDLNKIIKDMNDNNLDGLNVLSVFDGISCGHIALDRAGVKVKNYFASEIKQMAINTTQRHYPNTIQLGDITKIDSKDLPNIDLFIGGSPCQDFSSTNKERLGLEGEKSGLFYQYLRLLRELKPKYFLLENVAMKKDQEEIINNLLGVQPIKINSSLLSAQSRPRLYWTNIPNITIPEDKEFDLNDILESGYSPIKKSRCLLVSDSRPLTTPVKMFHRFYRFGLTTLIFKSRKHYEDCVKYYNEHFKGMAAKDIKCDNHVFDGVRYLTKKEREKLQTMPDGYCDEMSNNEAANVLGDGWTVDVIAHIFKGLNNI